MGGRASTKTQGHRQRLQEPPCPPDQEPQAVEDQSRESGRADHHSGSRDRRVAGPVGGVGGGSIKTRLRPELHRGSDPSRAIAAPEGSEIARNPPKYTEKRIRINFPFPCPSRVFRGYAFVMTFLPGMHRARTLRGPGASGVSSSGPDSVRACPRKFSSPSGRPVRSWARRAFKFSSLMAPVQNSAPVGGHLQQRSDLHQGVITPSQVSRRAAPALTA